MSRTTRSNSNPDLSTDTIKTLLENLKLEIFKEIKNESKLLGSRLDAINEKFEKFEMQLLHLQSNVLENSEQIRLMEKSVKEIEEKCSNQIEEVCDEVQQRHFRRSNVILRGLPELSSGDQTERNCFDLEKCQAIFRTLGVEEDDILFVKRVGKIRRDLKRILKVNCRDEKTVEKLLMRAKTLRTTDNFRSVYLGRDLTLRQQREEKALREELVRRRKNGQNVVVYRGKICDKNEIGKVFERQSFQKGFYP